MSSAAVWVSLLAGLVNLVIALVVLLAGYRQRLHRACAAWGLSVAVWNLGVFALGVVSTEAVAEAWASFTWMGVVFLPISIVHFMELSFDRPRRRYGRWYAASAVVAATAWTPFFIEGVRWVGDTWYARPGPGLWVFVLVAMPLCYVVTLRMLWNEARLGQAQARKRARLLMGVLIACQVLGANDILPVLGWEKYPFTEVEVPILGAWAAALYAVVVGHGIFSDQLIELRIALGRSAANLLRMGLLFTLCGVLLLLFHAWAPDYLPLGGVAGALGTLIVASVLAGFFSPRLLLQPSEKLRERVYGDRFHYLDKLRALNEELYLNTDTVRGFSRVCEGLREVLRLGSVVLWYRDPLGAPQRVPREAFELSVKAGQTGWAAVEREFRTWQDREDLWVIALRTAGEAPSGYLRLEAMPGQWLRLNELDREVVAELVGQLAHQVEREAIRASLQLRRTSEAKDRFLASINHEIRNPLNGMVGMVELLGAEPLTEMGRRRLATMGECADQLVAVLDNALDFASLVEGRLSERKSRFELGALLRGSVAHLEIGREGSVLWQLPEQAVWLRGDAGKLRQIIANYVGNALKYGQPSRAEVRAELRGTRRGGKELLVEVRNRAPMEAAEDLPEWFQPFRRGERAQRSGQAGSGLGLAIAQRLAEAMKGQVGARRERADLVFYVSCPVEETEAMGVGAESGAGLVDRDQVGREVWALVIEDEAYNREVLLHYLAGWGVRTKSAASGAEAIAVVERRRPDVIITDWLLGDTDGAALLPRLAAGGGGVLPPTIVLSAYATEEKAEEARQAGATRFLTKPLRAAELRRALGEVLPPGWEGGRLVEGESLKVPTEEEIRTRLGEAWLEASELMAGANGEAAARVVHRMRGLARLMPGPSELPDALADLERALDDGADTAVRRAARSGVEVLLGEVPPWKNVAKK